MVAVVGRIMDEEATDGVIVFGRVVDIEENWTFTNSILIVCLTVSPFAVSV